MNFEEKGIDKSILIPPMIIISLIENSFKHGVAKSMDQSWINIKISVLQQTLNIHIANSIKPNNVKNTEHGIGLTNVQRRLALIYENNFEFTKTKNSSNFTVVLKINLSK